MLHFSRMHVLIQLLSCHTNKPVDDCSHSVVAPPGCRDKVGHGAHLQTFSYPMIPRLFSNSNTLMAKWRSQTLSFKSVTKKRRTTPPLAACVARAPPNLAWWYRRSVLFLHLQNMFASDAQFRQYVVRGRWKFGVMCTPRNSNSHNSVTPWANPPTF